MSWILSFLCLWTVKLQHYWRLVPKAQKNTYIRSISTGSNKEIGFNKDWNLVTLHINVASTARFMKKLLLCIMSWSNRTKPLQRLCIEHNEIDPSPLLLHTTKLFFTRCRKMNFDVFVCFIDYRKAFGSASHQKWIKILRTAGINKGDLRTTSVDEGDLRII